MWHFWIIELSEPEGRFTQFTVLFLRVRQPFHQARLMNEFDTPATPAGIKQLVIFQALPTADSTCIRFFEALFFPVGIDIRSVRRIIHQVWEGPRARIPAGLILRVVHIGNVAIDNPTWLR